MEHPLEMAWGKTHVFAGEKADNGAIHFKRA
jgi:hypothetical protein